MQSLDRTASILNESSVYKDHVSALYGIGSTTGILNLLDQGIIDGLVTYDQFSQGYLSMKKSSGSHSWKQTKAGDFIRSGLSGSAGTGFRCI